MSPLDFFSGLPEEQPGVNDRANLVDAAYPECSAEQFSVSRYSQGVVENNEFVFRYIFSPIHLENDGTVKAAAFSDVENKGLSCDRGVAMNVHPDMNDRGVAQVEAYNRENPEKPRREYLGCVRGACGEIRSLIYQSSGRRAFAVYDTALISNPDHVDVFQTMQDSPAQRKLLRKQLRDRFTRVPSR